MFEDFLDIARVSDVGNADTIFALLEGGQRIMDTIDRDAVVFGRYESAQVRKDATLLPVGKDFD